MRTKLQRIGFHLFIFVATLTSSAAWGAGWETWNGTSWQTSGSSFTLSGPTTFIVIGNVVPCSFTFNVQLANVGTLLITTMTGSGSSACSSISARSLPWVFSAPTALGSGVSFSFPVSFVYSGFNCAGTISATMTNANPNSGHTSNAVTFNASLGSCTLKTNPSISTGGPVQAFFP